MSTNFLTTYGRPWRRGSALGQHDEGGYIIETVDGLRVFITPDLSAVARAFGYGGNSFHVPEAWTAYHELVDLVVQDHNDALDREEARRAQAELSSADPGIHGR